MSSPNPSTAITSVMQIAITVGDVASATTYYRDAVGLPFLFAAGPALAFLDAGGTRLMLSVPEGGLKPGGGTVLYFKVADIVAAHREMSARGVTFLAEPHLIARMPTHDLWLCEFKDPDGNHLALMSEQPKAG